MRTWTALLVACLIWFGADRAVAQDPSAVAASEDAALAAYESGDLLGAAKLLGLQSGDRTTSTGPEEAALVAVVASQLGLTESSKLIDASLKAVVELNETRALAADLHFARGSELVNEALGALITEDSEETDRKSRAAADHLGQAVRRYEAAGAINSWRYADAKVSLAWAPHLDDPDQALTSVASAIANLTEADERWKDHPFLLLRLGDLQAATGGEAAAAATLKAGLAAAQRDYPRHPIVAAYHGLLATVLAEQHFDQAVAEKELQIAFWKDAGFERENLWLLLELAELYEFEAQPGIEEPIERWLKSTERYFGRSSDEYRSALSLAASMLRGHDDGELARERVLRELISAEEGVGSSERLSSAVEDLAELLRSRASEFEGSGESERAKILNAEADSLQRRQRDGLARAAVSAEQRLETELAAAREEGDGEAEIAVLEQLVSERRKLQQLPELRLNLEDLANAYLTEAGARKEYAALALARIEELVALHSLLPREQAGLPRLLLWKAGVLALLGTPVEADRTLKTGLEEWKAALASDPAGDDLRVQTYYVLAPLARLSHDLKEVPPSLAGLLARIFDRQQLDAPRQDAPDARRMTTALDAAFEGDDAAPPIRRALHYIYASVDPGGDELSKLLQELMPSNWDERAAYIAEVEAASKKSSVQAAGAEALVAIMKLEHLLDAPRPIPALISGEEAWIDVAEAHIASGDFKAARGVLAQAPPEQRMEISEKIAIGSEDPEDLQRALDEVRRAKGSEDAAWTLGRIIDWRFKKGAEWQQLAEQMPPEHQWRIADRWFAAGEADRGLALLKGANDNDLTQGIIWSAKAAAEQGSKEALVGSLEALARETDRIVLPHKRVEALHELAEQFHSAAPERASAIAGTAADVAKKLGSKDCDRDICRQLRLSALAELYASWEQVEPAIDLIEELDADEQHEEFAKAALAFHQAGRHVEARTLLDRAMAGAKNMKVGNDAARAWRNIGPVQAKMGDIDGALRSAQMQTQLGTTIGDRKDNESAAGVEYLILAGALQRAEQIAETIKHPLDLAVARVKLARSWAERGDQARTTAALKRLHDQLPELTEDFREHVRDRIEDVAEAQAAAGWRSAFTTLTEFNAPAYALLGVIRALPSTTPPDEIARAVAATIPKVRFDDRPARRTQQMARIAAELATRGAVDEARRTLAALQAPNPPQMADQVDVAGEASKLIEGLQAIARRVEPGLAEPLAQRLYLTELNLNDHSALRMEVLRLAISLGERGIEALPDDEWPKNSIAKSSAEKALAGLDPAFAQKYQLTLAEDAAAEMRGIANRRFPFLDYYALAARHASEAAPPIDLLTVIRAATESHRQHLIEMLGGARVRFPLVEEQVRQGAHIYFLHLDLLRQAIAADGPDVAALKSEAFRVAQYAMLDATSLELELGRESQRGQELRRLERELADHLRKIEITAPTEANARAAAEERERQLRTAIRTIYSGSASLMEKMVAPLETVQRSLRPDEAMLLYVPNHSSSVSTAFTGRTANAMMMVVRKDDLALVELETAHILIEDEIEKFRASLAPYTTMRRAAERVTAGAPAADAAAGESLYDTGAAYRLYWLLIRPVSEQLQGVKQLTVVARSVLGALPLQVLITEPSAPVRSYGELAQVQWLARSYVISNVPGVDAVVGRSREDRVDLDEASFLGFGNPLFNAAGASLRPSSILQDLGRPDLTMLKALAPLPETAEELSLTASALGVAVSEAAGSAECLVCTGDNAREAHLRMLSERGILSKYRFMSFATHGLVPGDLDGLQEAALVLTTGDAQNPEDDGLLLASEVAELKLGADIVVLSACNTGTNNGSNAEGLSGLVSGFLHAGAGSVLVSHWAVDSNATADLIVRTTRAFAADPSAGYAAALQRAMLEMADGKVESRWAHPYFWAPFSLVDARSTAL